MKQADFRWADALGNDLGDKRLDILRRIGDSGSISSAARAAGVSYKAAWQAIDTLANLAGTPLVDTAVGGSGGGGAHLTEAAWRLLDAAERIKAARTAVLAELRDEALAGGGGRRGGDRPGGGSNNGGSKSAAPGAANAAMASLGLRTSLRNQLPCRVTALQRQGSQRRVLLNLADGTVIRSRITRESAELLALAPGLPALALCKATAVTISASPPAGGDAVALARSGPEARQTPATRPPDTPNRLIGTVVRIARTAAGSTELALELPSGLRLVGFAAAGHGLARQQRAVALFDETAVVIALAQL